MWNETKAKSGGHLSEDPNGTTQSAQFFLNRTMQAIEEEDEEIRAND